MAEKPEKQEKQASTLVAPRYPISELSAHAEALFSVQPEVLAGALHGVNGKELSIDEAKRLIKQFLEKKVK